MSKPTVKQAEKVVEAIKKAFPAYVTTFALDADGKTDYENMVPVTDPQRLPRIRTDWDGCDVAIVWEDCSPYGWAHNFPFGGVDEEFGGTIDDVSAMLPPGIHAEAITSYAVAIYKEG